jgi:hypothetical protein
MEVESQPEVKIESSGETNDVKNAALTPPTSEDMDKKYLSSSELSDLESDDGEDDDWEIEPDHYWDGGKIPVFKPVSDMILQYLIP